MYYLLLGLTDGTRHLDGLGIYLLQDTTVASFSVQVLPGPPSLAASTITIPTKLLAGSNTRVNVQVRDEWGNNATSLTMLSLILVGDKASYSYGLEQVRNGDCDLHPGLKLPHWLAMPGAWHNCSLLPPPHPHPHPHIHMPVCTWLCWML